jgi:hypothetical protein
MAKAARPIKTKIKATLGEEMLMELTEKPHSPLRTLLRASGIFRL